MKRPPPIRVLFSGVAEELNRKKKRPIYYRLAGGDQPPTSGQVRRIARTPKGFGVVCLRDPNSVWPGEEQEKNIWELFLLPIRVLVRLGVKPQEIGQNLAHHRAVTGLCLQIRQQAAQEREETTHPKLTLSVMPNDMPAVIGLDPENGTVSLAISPLFAQVIWPSVAALINPVEFRWHDDQNMLVLPAKQVKLERKSKAVGKVLTILSCQGEPVLLFHQGHIHAFPEDETISLSFDAAGEEIRRIERQLLLKADQSLFDLIKSEFERAAHY